jgi:hypothetical protein
MNSFSRIPKRELERLSAYLDGALSTRETAWVEARLREDPALQAALEELRRTSHLLRMLPTVRVPRDFTLTPQMVGQVPKRPAYPALRLATALASLALVLVVGFDALSGSLLQTATAPLVMERSAPADQFAEEVPKEGAEMRAEAPVPEAEMMDEGLMLEAEAPAEAPVSEPDMLAEAPAPADEAMVGAISVDEGETMVEEREAPMAEGAPKYAAEAEDALSGEVATPWAVEATPPAPQAAVEEEGVPPTVSALALEAQPEEAAKALDNALPEEQPHGAPAISESEPMPGTIPTISEAPQPPFWTPLRLVEIALAIVVVMLAAMTWWVRKTGQ